MRIASTTDWRPRGRALPDPAGRRGGAQEQAPRSPARRSADSSAYIPGHSPGRAHPRRRRDVQRDSRCVVRRFGAAYIIRVATAVCSANSRTVEVCSTTSWAIAVRRPSRVGAEPHALDRRRAVAGQREHLLARDRELDRPPDDLRRERGEDDAAAAACPWSRSRRRRAARSRARCSGSRPKTCASVVARARRALGRVPDVRSPPSQRAIVACGSIGLLWKRGRLVGRRRRSTAAARRPASTSPCSVSVGKAGLTFSGV